MYSNPLEMTLLDVLENIYRARMFIEGLNYSEFVDSPLHNYATVRALEIISEASRRLPQEVKNKYPNIMWQDISGSGNVYRHDHEDVLLKIVWDTAHGLNDLEDFVHKELTALRSA